MKKDINLKAYFFTSVILLLSAQVQAGLIDETWQVQVSSVDGDYSNYAVDDILSFTLTYDNESLKKTENFYGIFDTYCTGSAIADADCTYAWPSYDLFADISDESVSVTQNVFFDMASLFTDGGSVDDGLGYKVNWLEEGYGSGLLNIVDNDFSLSSSYLLAPGSNLYYSGSASLNYFDATGGYNYSFVNFDVLAVTSVPSVEVDEPTTFALFGLAMFGLVARRKKAAK